MRIAYICNRYPAVSLTFIQREIRALRGLGIEIDTFAIRRAFPAHILSAADREELASTFAVLPPSVVRFVTSHVSAFVGHPLRYVRTLALALRMRPRGARGALWQLFYFAEAIVVWRQCNRRGIRHLHAHFANVAADVALLTTAFGGARDGWSWSFTLHGPVEFFDLSQSRLGAKLSRARFVVCISDFARSQAMAHLGHEQWPKLHVVHCAVDAHALRPARATHRNGALRLLSVGRLIRLKGHATLLEAIVELRAHGVITELTLVGDGPDRSFLEALARRLDIDESVVFAGAVGQDDIGAFYDSADVFCLASFAEGVPVVLMEAMAMGLPVVTTGIAGIPELVEDQVSGLIVSPGRSDRFAAALYALSREPELRRRMGDAGRRKVSADFDLVRSAQALRDIFVDELESPTPSRPA